MNFRNFEKDATSSRQDASSLSDFASPLTELRELVNANQPIAPDKRHRLALYYGKAFVTSMLGQAERWFYQRKLQAYRPQHPPLFILGHWRSGTSFLQATLAQAPDYTHFNKFQALFPRSFLLTRRSLKPLIDYTLNHLGPVQAWRKRISHDFQSLDSAAEIEVALVNQMSPYSFHWGQVFPQNWQYYFDRYLFMEGISQREYHAWQRAVLHLNKKVNYLHPEKRLLVKNPGDTARVRHLLKLYPEARFIFIHRNPYDVFYSNIKLWKLILASLAVQDTSEAQIKVAIRYIYRRMHERYLEDRALIPPEQRVEIDYESFRLAPVDTLAEVYEHLRLPGFDEHQAGFQAYADSQQYRPSRYVYLREDITQLNQEWGHIFEALGYEPLLMNKAREGTA
jgi:omega-hydroxy-beta-dihydromenaquinone-9 sulfotransferase